MRRSVPYTVVGLIGVALLAFVIYIESVGFDNFCNNNNAQCEKCHTQHQLASAGNRFDRYYPGFHLESDWDFSNVQGPCRVYRYKDATFAGKAEFALLKVFALIDGAVLVTTINEDPIATLL